MLLPVRLESHEVTAFFAGSAGVTKIPAVHGLIVSMMSQSGLDLQAVEIGKPEDDELEATLVLARGEEELIQKAGIGDAMVLAFHMAVPIFLAQEAMSAAVDMSAQHGGSSPRLGGPLPPGSPAQEAPQLSVPEGTNYSAADIDAAIDQLLSDVGLEDEGSEVTDPAQRIEQLRKRLKLSIKLEHYEDAGHILDQLEELEAEM